MKISGNILTETVRRLPIAIAALFVCTISLVVVWLGDDIDYAYKIKTALWDSWGHLNNPADLLTSQINHYLNVNGRFTAHTIVQIFCAFLGQIPFAVCNAAVYFIFISLICKASSRLPETPSRENLNTPDFLNSSGFIKPGFARHFTPATALCASALVLLTFVTKMVPSTQIGFVWMFCLTLFWLKLYYTENRKSPIFTASLAILALFAGNGQEALSLGICVALLISLLTNPHRLKIRWWLPALCYAIGCSLDCFSPSSISRAFTSGASDSSFAESLAFLLISLRATYLLIITATILLLTKKINVSDIFRRKAFWVIVFLSLLIFNLCIGVYSNRQLFGMELAALIITLDILPRHSFGKILNTLLAVLAVILLVWQGSLAIEVRRQYSAIEKAYIESPKGVVYYDRLRVCQIPFMRDFRMYEEIIGNGDNDLRHSLMKRFKLELHLKKHFYILPQAVSDPSIKSKDTIVEYAPHHFCIISHNFTRSQLDILTDRGDTITIDLPRPAYKGKRFNVYTYVPDNPFQTPTALHPK